MVISIPVVGLPQNQSVKFHMDTTYILLSCSKQKSYRERSGECGTYIGTVWRGPENVLYTRLCDVRAFCRDPRLSSLEVVDAPFFLDMPQEFQETRSTTSCRNTSAAAPTRRMLHFGQLQRNLRPIGQVRLFNVAVTNCAVAEVRIEVAVECAAGCGCWAAKMRLSQA